MISFRRFGEMGRLGNQLFQYVFLRSTAKRLGVKFYCPSWFGDDIFLLEDEKERCGVSPIARNVYCEPSYFGFNSSALEIEDEADIQGYFQTEKYFDRYAVKKWFSFKKEKIAAVEKKYQQIDFSNSVGMQLRFEDKLRIRGNRQRYYLPPTAYYERALTYIQRKKNILIFSDEIGLARERLKNLDQGNFLWVEGNLEWEDLYLMTQCHDFVCSGSTLSWWGAWLNGYNDKTIVVPKEGPTRPGCPLKNNDYWPAEWTKIRSLWPIIDDYQFVCFREQVLNEIRSLFKKKL